MNFQPGKIRKEEGARWRKTARGSHTREGEEDKGPFFAAISVAAISQMCKGGNREKFLFKSSFKK